MMFKDYKVAISGATSGIGLAAAKLFLSEGAAVVGLGRNFDRTKELGERFIPFKCEVREPEQIDKACAFIGETFGGVLDTFVNNAGVGEHVSVRELSAERFDRAFALLLRAPMLFGKGLYPMLVKSKTGNASIVNVASAASRTCAPDNPLYNLAKNALVLYTKQQTAGFIGVRANSVSPGFIDTPIFARSGVAADRDTALKLFEKVSYISCGRVGQPEEVADLIAFLASEDAKYINGADVLIDGGLMTVNN